MKMKYLLLAVAWLSGLSLFSQDYFPKNDGVKAENNNYTAFTRAHIHVSPTQVIENGTLLIREGKVVAAGTNVTIPPSRFLRCIRGFRRFNNYNCYCITDTYCFIIRK